VVGFELILTALGTASGVAAVGVAVLQLKRTPRDLAEPTRQELPEPSEVQIGPFTWGPPTGRLVDLRGRNGLLTGLEAQLDAADDRFHVLAGLGGTGKTAVALALAAKAQAQGHSVWWVPVTDAGTVTASLIALAAELGAPTSEVSAARAGTVNPSDVLWRRLNGMSRWLLIFDNADAPAALTIPGSEVGDGTGWLRPTRRGMVVVTSRIADPQIWGRHGILHVLDCLNDSDGSRLLLDLAPQAGTPEEAAALSRRLGGLPLALGHAGAYLRSPFAAERSFAAYREALAERAGARVRGDDPRQLVAETWAVSLDALAAQGRPLARVLLNVLACFAPSVDVPFLLLDTATMRSACGASSDREVRIGLEDLLTLGLIKSRSVGGSSVVVHPLVADAGRMPPDPMALRASAALMRHAAETLDPNEPGDWPRWNALVVHLRELLQAPDSAFDEPARSALVRSVTRACLMLLANGSYDEARQLGETAQQACTPEAPHVEVLALQRTIAVAIGRQGRKREAQRRLIEIAESQRCSLGTDHPDLLATQHEIVLLLRERGRRSEAEALCRKVIAARTRVLGADSTETLLSRFHLAYVLDGQGRFAEAEAEYRSVLEAQTRALGADHPSVLATRNEIVDSLLGQGRYALAEAEARLVLQKREKVLGSDHPDSFATRVYLCDAIEGQGRYQELEDERRKLLRDQVRVLGPHASEVLDSRLHMAKSVLRQGQAPEAEALLRDLLSDYERTFDATYPDALYARHWLAKAIAARGRLTEAETLFQEVIAEITPILGPDSPYTLFIRHDHATVKAAQGRLTEARRDLTEVTEARARKLGLNHPYTLESRYELALMACDEQREKLQGILEAQQHVLGPGHPKVRETRRALQELG
jgi:tetratricopeptide (TPR) repeat protein